MPLAPKMPADPWPSKVHTEQEIRDKLAYARELLVEHDKGLTNSPLTRGEIVRRLDNLLEEFCELMELQWVEALEVIA